MNVLCSGDLHLQPGPEAVHQLRPAPDAGVQPGLLLLQVHPQPQLPPEDDVPQPPRHVLPGSDPPQVAVYFYHSGRRRNAYKMSCSDIS